jgi:valyl-tRNA synthetase
MPFLTESLCQLIPHKGDSIMMSDWPQLEDSGPLPTDPTAEAGFKSMQSLVRTIRNARAEYNVEPGRKIAALVRLSSSSPSATVFGDLLKTEVPALAMLARLDEKLLQILVVPNTNETDEIVKSLGKG